MLRSMFSGVSGLRSHQTMMDVIGNNIANVNTVGYKAGSVVFQDLLSQVLRGAGVPTAGGAGGTNPAQVGLGVRTAGVSTSFTQGAAQMTGRSTDLSIEGDGFFVVRKDGQELYTRAGSFSFDALGRLTTTDGAVVQGWPADATGAINADGPVAELTMPLGQTTAPSATRLVRLGGNVDAATAAGEAVTTKIGVYDDTGAAIDVTFSFQKTANADEWAVTATFADAAGATEALGPFTTSWDGATKTFAPGLPNLQPTAVGRFAQPVAVDIGAGAAGGLTQHVGDNGLEVLGQDGSPLGALQSFAIGDDGTLVGTFSNGTNRPLGRLALAAFANPVGLEKVGGSLYRGTVNSGLANVGTPGTNGRGTLLGSTLEMSNVDLAQEFTNLIVAQRGFQANSRVITASDELLQDLVNLKR